MKSARTLSPVAFLVLALMGACFSTGTASGQDSKGRSRSWDNLKSLAPGQEICLVMYDLKSYQGKFESLSDDAITLRRSAREQTLARQDILRVSLKKGQDHSARNVVIGTLVGAVAGFWVGRAIDRPNRNCTEGPAFNCSGPANAHWREALTPGGGAAGSVVGAALSTRGWHDVYRAQ